MNAVMNAMSVWIGHELGRYRGITTVAYPSGHGR